MKKTYKVLHTITLSAINSKRPCSSGFAEVLDFAMLHNTTKTTSTVDWSGAIPADRLHKMMDMMLWQQEWTEWLINEGFIEEILPERQYSKDMAYFLVPRGQAAVLQIRKMRKAVDGKVYRVFCLDAPYDDSYNCNYFKDIEEAVAYHNTPKAYYTYDLVEMPVHEMRKRLGFGG